MLDKLKNWYWTALDLIEDHSWIVFWVLVGLVLAVVIF